MCTRSYRGALIQCFSRKYPQPKNNGLKFCGNWRLKCFKFRLFLHPLLYEEYPSLACESYMIYESYLIGPN